jgi:outer membrane protein assembly factor BamB
VVIGAIGAGLLGVASLGLSAGCANGGEPLPEEGKIVPVPAGNFTVAWRAQLEPQRDALVELHLVEDRVYAYSRNHVSYAIDRASGGLQFITPVKISGDTLRPPIHLPERVVFPSASSLEVYDKSGRYQHPVDLPYPTRSAGIGVSRPGTGDFVVLGLDYPRGGRAAAITVDRPYGNVRWELMTFGGVSSRPAYYDNVLYIASEDGRVYAVGPDRDAHWPLEGGVYVTSGRIVADLVADASGVYVASSDSKLYCVDRTTGKTKWQYFGGNALTDDPQVTEDSVYLAVPGQGVVAIDKNEGEFNRPARWEVRDARQFLAADKQNVYLRRRDNAILAVDKRTGEEKFASRTKAFEVFASNTTSDDGTIFAADKGGLVVAVRPVLSPGTVGELVRADAPDAPDAPVAPAVAPPPLAAAAE